MTNKFDPSGAGARNSKLNGAQASRFLPGPGRTRLRIYMSLFFIAIAAPGLLIVRQAFDQIKWESFHQFQNQAIELSTRIDKKIKSLIEIEEARSFGEYGFTVVSGDINNNYVQLSRLADFPLEVSLPGVLGYFQLDPDNQFSSPLLPPSRQLATSYGLSAEQIDDRETRQNKVKAILGQNRLLEKKTDENVFDFLERSKKESVARVPGRKKNKSVDEYKLDTSFRSKQLMSDRQIKSPAIAAADEIRSAADAASSFSRYRSEQELILEEKVETVRADELSDESSNAKVYNLFEGKISSFYTSLLDSGHLLLYRYVWQEKQRYIQGILIEQDKLLQALVVEEYRTTSIANMSSLAVVWKNQVLNVYPGRNDRAGYFSETSLSGTLLHRHRLSVPMSEWELLYTIEHLPSGASGRVVLLSAGVFMLILSLGCWVIYRMVLKQLMLVAQQQNFVSSISHELKTPLTSIRMYGEMLRKGWATEAKKREYYDFIFHESERLTRLINNILQLARMTRSELPVELKTYKVSELMDMIQSTIASQLERAGFELQLGCEGGDVALDIDADLFIQAIINLVDNAIKFSLHAEDKRVVLSFVGGSQELKVTVRDFGPGIDKIHSDKIFTLFYRAENELTRETKGTGIGLSLVSEIVSALKGKIELKNCEPGAAFCLRFPIAKDQPAAG